MAQARVYLPKDHPQKEKLETLGFRFCKKDGRWECIRKDVASLLKQVTEIIPEAKVEDSTKPSP
jgi:hypothetical protein